MMNLPLILDTAIGLVFIYLVLSLLASEIQELLATLLQWRAVHLKKSIEILLTGGEGTVEEESVEKIVNELYDNPLIKNINQESKQGIEGWFRQLIWQIGEVYRILTKKKTTSFGVNELGKAKRSAPSYIPSETFAVTLVESLNITVLAQKLSELNLKKLQEHEIQSEIKVALKKLSEGKEGTDEETALSFLTGFKKLESKFDKIFESFQNGKATLETTIQRLQVALEAYSETCKNYLKDSSSQSEEEFIQTIQSIKEDVFYNSNELLERLKPSLTKIVELLDENSKIYTEIQEESQNIENPINISYNEIAGEIKTGINQLPKSIKKSLSALARQAQIKVDTIDQEVNQFKKEIESWFNQSMDRASGVYKRNAKGVTFLISLFLAFTANADTFHIVSRLSKDTALRNAITQNAALAASTCASLQVAGQTPSQLDCIRNEVNKTLETASIPLGWSSHNLNQQKEEELSFYGKSIPHLTRTLGWLLSSLAITMGAPFWFQTLNKFINIRNTGPKPASLPNEGASSIES